MLDADDGNALLGQLTPQLQSWTPAQIAAAVTASLPCLGDVPPSDAQQFVLLFAATGAAAGGMSPQEAARVLLVLAQLPGYAPDAQVRQLLTARSCSYRVVRISVQGTSFTFLAVVSANHVCAFVGLSCCCRLHRHCWPLPCSPH